MQYSAGLSHLVGSQDPRMPPPMPEYPRLQAQPRYGRLPSGYYRTPAMAFMGRPPTSRSGTHTQVWVVRIPAGRGLTAFRFPLGWIKRFVNNCRKPQAERNFTPVLSPAERNAALCSLVRVVQAEHFEEENWEVLNTAVLTGGQVSQAMKVLIVSQAGQVADVTLQSSCHSEDESVLKKWEVLNTAVLTGGQVSQAMKVLIVSQAGQVADVTLQSSCHSEDESVLKNWKVLNTAVLTGGQVSQPMKVLIVSQVGQVADVTLQSSCHSEDESVLKVSSSCSSVYVDGSEIRGSSNASVIVKYGTYTGLARFTVWMPEYPLEIDVDDNRLSQIKGWKVSDDATTKERLKRSLSARGWGGSRPDPTNSLTDGRSCRLRYQQSNVEVYARFLAKDHDSGRVSYFVSRRTWLKVTELVMSLMRVSDPRIASLREGSAGQEHGQD
ncbi:hypothetical protein NE865_06076 [Phthorimaea operculella]|nr:hypothetical protein NE865_06076 [Phthorimaea operculella]